VRKLRMPSGDQDGAGPVQTWAPGSGQYGSGEDVGRLDYAGRRSRLNAAGRPAEPFGARPKICPGEMLYKPLIRMIHYASVGGADLRKEAS